MSVAQRRSSRCRLVVQDEPYSPTGRSNDHAPGNACAALLAITRWARAARALIGWPPSQGAQLGPTRLINTRSSVGSRIWLRRERKLVVERGCRGHFDGLPRWRQNWSRLKPRHVRAWSQHARASKATGDPHRIRSVADPVVWCTTGVRRPRHNATAQQQADVSRQAAM